MKGCKWLKIAEVAKGKAGTKMQGSLSYTFLKKKEKWIGQNSWKTKTDEGEMPAGWV